MVDFPAPPPGLRLTHFIVSNDVARARHFYADILGGTVVHKGLPTIVALANGWVTISEGGGPTPDKPTVNLAVPGDPDAVSSFLNLRVDDIDDVHRRWSAAGAVFLTPPIEREAEYRCYMRDPDGHLIEVGQSKDGSI